MVSYRVDGAIRSLLTTCVFLFGSWVAGLAQERNERAPIPGETAKVEAVKLVSEIYRAEWEAAATSEEKTALAEKMIDQAVKAGDDRAGQFVLLRIARDVAVQAGDVTTALRAVELLEQEFQIDAAAMKTEALLGAADSPSRPEHAQALAEQSIPLIQAAVDKDDYDTAGRLLRAAQAAVRKAPDADLLSLFKQWDRDLDRIVRAYDAVKPALQKMKEEPLDAEANLAAGKFYAFVKGDWEKGIPFLALGGDAALKALAGKELGEVTSPEEQVALADAWWDLAQDAEASEKIPLLLHAAAWYEKAFPRLTGELVKAKVEKRLQETEELASPMGLSSGRPPGSSESPSSRLPRWKFVGVCNYNDEFLNHPQVPAELAAEYANGRARIWGVCRHDKARIEGRLTGWFGKGLVWQAARPSLLPAELILESDQLSPNSNRGPRCVLTVVAGDGKRVARLTVPLTEKRLTLTVRPDLSEDTITLAGTSGQPAKPSVAPVTAALDAKLPLTIVLGIAVRYRGELCDTRITLKAP